MSGDTLRVVIVDDEPLARTVVREYLKHHAGVEIVAECGNGFDAVKAVTEGTFKGGGVYSGTLDNNGVGIAPFHDFDSKVPADLKSKLDELKKGIIDGSVSVDPKDYQA